MTRRATAVVGVGCMGLPMALRLLDAGFAVTVRDVIASREEEARAAGARAVASAGEAAAATSATVVAVVDDADVEAVLFGAGGIADGAARGHAVVLCSTLSPGSVESAAIRLGERGIDCIDAPMSGGPARARDGSMSLMVAGDDSVVARHGALLDALSSRIVRVGTRPGDGARTKLVNNLLAAVHLAGAAEAIALAERLGLDPARTLDVIEQSSGQSWIGSDRLRRALAGDLVPRARTALLAKDSRLAMAMADAAGFEPTLGRVAAALFARACREGSADLDDASLLDVVRRLPLSS